MELYNYNNSISYRWTGETEAYVTNNIWNIETQTSMD